MRDRLVPPADGQPTAACCAGNEMPAQHGAKFAWSTDRGKRVIDGHADALALVGAQGVVDLMKINAYCTLLAMVMNAAQTPAPPLTAAPLPVQRQLTAAQSISVRHRRRCHRRYSCMK